MAKLQHYADIVAKYLPDGWKLKIVRRIVTPEKDNPDGLCCFTTKTIYSKPIRSIGQLQVFLHEVAHVELHSGRDKEPVIEEYEAEMWSFAALVNEGIPVTEAMLSDAKANIRTRLAEHDMWDAMKWALS